VARYQRFAGLCYLHLQDEDAELHKLILTDHKVVAVHGVLCGHITTKFTKQSYGNLANSRSSGVSRAKMQLMTPVAVCKILFGLR